jgi:hypothetical protein
LHAAPAAPPPDVVLELARPAVPRLAVRARPGGKVIFRLPPRTAFGSPRVLGVAARRAPWVGLGRARGRWLGVITPALPNGRLGWVRQGAVRLRPAPYAIVVHLSTRTLVLRRRHRLLRESPVGIGEPGSPTPTGTFVVTDKLAGDAVYGCCILALSGHQPHPPAGWRGGTRLAIHGGPLGPASAGCIHADEADLRYLMAVVPLGTPVTILR